MRALFSIGSLLAAQVGGAVLGSRRVAQSVETVNRMADEDCDSIRSSGLLNLAKTPAQASARPPRSNFNRFLTGMLWTATWAGLLAFLLLMMLTGMASDPTSVGTRLAGSALVAAIVAAVAAFVPGLGIGLSLVVGETRRRLEYDGGAHLRSYWEGRERLRQSLLLGSISPEDAYRHIASYRVPAGVPVPPQSYGPPRPHQIEVAQDYPLDYDPRR